MQYFFFLLVSGILSSSSAFASKIETGVDPSNSLIDSTSWGLVDVLNFAEGMLLKVVLPLVVIATALYVAYELFLAEGDEEKLKKAWKSLTYSSVGLIAIALAYSVISIVSRLAI